MAYLGMVRELRRTLVLLNTPHFSPSLDMVAMTQLHCKIIQMQVQIERVSVGALDL
jgi:hypothetical protein